MVNRLLFILLITLTAVSCRHKELGEEIPNRSGDVPIKVVVNWNNSNAKALSMRINLFSLTHGVADYGRDELPTNGVKYIYLEGGASYRPFCYDYNASGIYFRNEQNMETFEAYFSGMSRATYNNYASPAKNEATYSAPTGSDFYVHSWSETFDVDAESEEEQELLFEPQNVLRHFTYRIDNILGRENIKDVRGAASGMASVFIFHTGKATEVRSTMLFGNIQVKFDSEKNYGYLEGEFYTFGPLEPYENWFTIELTSHANQYFTASWDISEQVRETMENREGKLTKDGYDLLIWNNPDVGIPEIDPGEEGPGSGFEIGIGEWGDEVIIKL